ncbi:ATP-grasp domain-containing protein [Geobacter sp.]|uniref:carboxylate--amine ligase n=1 Tax=Geobacter sp. TaxID=46610 RepID=UPI0026381C1E|nr:ATP-grasp domain-containing protein [Geobacter sp.]
MNILVTDGENRSALATTRSLGRKGHNIFVTGTTLENISAASRFCRKAFTVPDPLNEGIKYSQTIAEIVNRETVDMIFPMTEQSIYCLNKARESLGKSVKLACVPHEKMEAVSNKYNLFQLAEKLGVAIPETIYLAGPDDLLGKKTQISRFPVVVKPAYSKIEHGDRIISARVMYASGYNELNRLYETKAELRYPSLIQEQIAGEGTGLFTLFDHDRHLALFSHRRLLEKPPSGGVSVLSESVPLDEEMVEAAGKLLSEVQWSGIAMVEFKRDKRDGKAKLMEVNGRFWGSLQLAISSGVDFPLLSLDYCLGNLGKEPHCLLANYSVGHKLKWFFGLLDHLIIRFKSRARSFEYPSDYSTRWQVIKELFKAGDANTSFDVYDSEDLMPFISEAKTYIRNLISKRK